MRARLAMAGLVALMMVAGCRSHTPDASLAQRTGGPIAAGWSLKLPEGYDGWTVKTGQGCVLLFAWSNDIKESVTHRQLRCHDPDDGELRWSREIPIQAGLIYDRVHMAGGRVIYQNNQQLVALDASDGDLVWTFDPGRLLIHEAYVSATHTVVSLDQDLLAVLDTDGGQWLSGFSVPRHRLVAQVDSDQHGPLAVVVRVAGDDPTTDDGGARLLALPLRGGAPEPTPPFPRPRVAWELPIDVATYNVHLIDGVLIGPMSRGQLWGVDPDDGAVLYQVADSTTARSNNLDEDPEPMGPPELARVSPADLDPAPRMPRNHLASLAPGEVLLSQGHRDGAVIQMLEVQARDPESFEPLWSLQLSSRSFFRIQQPLRAAHAVLLAGGRFATLVDSRTGRVLWRRTLDKSTHDWTHLATDGRALYLVLGREVEPRLEAIPLK